MVAAARGDPPLGCEQADLRDAVPSGAALRASMRTARPLNSQGGHQNRSGPGQAGYDRAMIKKLVILALLVALGVIAAKRLRGD